MDKFANVYANEERLVLWDTYSAQSTYRRVTVERTTKTQIHVKTQNGKKFRFNRRGTEVGATNSYGARTLVWETEPHARAGLFKQGMARNKREVLKAIEDFEAYPTEWNGKEMQRIVGQMIGYARNNNPEPPAVDSEQ